MRFQLVNGTSPFPSGHYLAQLDASGSSDFASFDVQGSASGSSSTTYGIRPSNLYADLTQNVINTIIKFNV